MPIYPCTVEAFMHEALYGPQGYYTRGLNFADPAHPQGCDFTTAPLLTPLFGASLATWVVHSWQALGTPTNFTLMEAGPGSGCLMRDILAYMQNTSPKCFQSCQSVLIETSPVLTDVQKHTLQAFPACRWSATLASSAHPTLVIANELLDAFPIRQWVGDTERQVIDQDGAPGFSHPDDAVTREDSPAMEHWLHDLKALPNLKAALLLDYGSPTSGTHDSLQALHRHQKVSPLTHMGEADLTAHVNFARVQEILGSEQCTLTDLGPFLLKHNLLNLAEAHINDPTTASALHRLLHPAHMGSLFKALDYRPAPHAG